MKRAATNIPASIIAKLRAKAVERKEEFGLLLSRYAIERLLYRLGNSEHRDRFTLKGATLFTVWGGAPHRATRDLDLLGSGSDSVDDLIAVFKSVCAAAGKDGLVFSSEIAAEQITALDEYGGVRLTMQAQLDTAKIPLQIDIAFGDVVTPAAKEESFPTILDLPAPKLRVYSRESVVAEKLEAIVKLGVINSRLKDYYDLWFVSQNFAFEMKSLAAAVDATFKRRQTPLPAGQPAGLGAEYVNDKPRQTQWKGFRSRSAPDAPESLDAVVDALNVFLLPVLEAVRSNSAIGTWPVGGPWDI